MPIKLKRRQIESGMELHASTKHQAFFVAFLLLFTIFSGRLFYCKKISFWSTETSQRSFLQHWAALMQGCKYEHLRTSKRIKLKLRAKQYF